MRGSHTMDEKTERSKLTDEERLNLATKLDKELDDFINGLEKKPYTKGWPKDRWEEEMAKHPFFMKKAPEPGEVTHPLYEGLQQLKYDPDENTPEELALSYKEDGNFNFKHKNYRLAVLAYTEGIKIKCGNVDIEATLLNNRSAAHYFLKNYRSSLCDCELALKLKPNYEKTIVRAANCCFATAQHQRCLEYCDKILETRPEHNEILALRQRCVDDRKCSERDSRKREVALKKKSKEDDRVLKEILSRNINVDCPKASLKMEHFNPHFAELADHRVSLDADCNLVWPVVFMYPEYGVMDFIQRFCEVDPIMNYLITVFADRPAWDADGKYALDNLNVYYENEQKNKVVRVNVLSKLRDVLQEKTFFLRGGIPSFLILPDGSEAEKKFLVKY